ncbi:alpha/beta hydrolase [Flavobacteriaceae bacterium S356]|uniref:Alpha/beta hydrolase n=1 Tax=Asprobacillus argus TaxID=3076534 RepID=A0ABU3LCH5_9FLAO|nr:alpha/beta hydrolase [Flavobacteriaceae bacterium S356]
MQKTVLFKNSKISFSDTGKGSVVVLLHGFLENNMMWKDVIPVLSKNRRVIAIELLGHGGTEAIGYVHSMELMAEAVKAVLKNLRIRRIALIGHSMGGYVALAFADKYPEKIKGLCLMNSTSLPDDDERKTLRARANKMVQNNFENMVRMSFTNLFSEKSRTVFKSELKMALEEALQTPVQGYIACQEGMRIRSNRMKVLQKNDFKRLIIIGKKDPVLDYETSLEEVKKTNAEAMVFNDGHMSHIENKSSLTEALKTFLRDL